MEDKHIGARPAPAGGDGDERRNKIKLVFAVAAVTLIIVVAWLLTLPLQLGKFRMFSDEEVGAWQATQQDMNTQSQDIRTSLDDLRLQLEETQDRIYEESGTTAGGNGSLDPERFAAGVRERLEQADSENHIDESDGE